MADSTIVVSDANDVDRTLRTDEVATVHTPHHIVASSALPAGASTSALQSTGNTSLATLAGAVSGSEMQVDLVGLGSSGAATATNQATGNGHLSTVAGAVSGTEMQVDLVGLGGAATAANQTTINSSIGTGNTSLSTLAGAVGGTEMQVDLVGLGGAATAANQATGNTSLGTIAGAVTGTEMQVDVLTVTAPSTVYHGKKTVTAGTDEVIAGSQALKSGVTVKALAGNAGIVYVGVENVASGTGFELSAKESVFIECDNTNRIWIDAATGSTDGITYIAS